MRGKRCHEKYYKRWFAEFAAAGYLFGGGVDIGVADHPNIPWVPWGLSGTVEGGASFGISGDHSVLEIAKKSFASKGHGADIFSITK